MPPRLHHLPPLRADKLKKKLHLQLQPAQLRLFVQAGAPRVKKLVRKRLPLLKPVCKLLKPFGRVPLKKDKHLRKLWLAPVRARRLRPFCPQACRPRLPKVVHARLVQRAPKRARVPLLPPPKQVHKPPTQKQTDRLTAAWRAYANSGRLSRQTRFGYTISTKVCRKTSPKVRLAATSRRRSSAIRTHGNRNRSMWSRPYGTDPRSRSACNAPYHHRFSNDGFTTTLTSG